MEIVSQKKQQPTNTPTPTSPQKTQQTTKQQQTETTEKWMVFLGGKGAAYSISPM